MMWAIVADAAQRWQRRAARRRDRTFLLNLPERDLRDMGLNRGDVFREFAAPPLKTHDDGATVWRAPRSMCRFADASAGSRRNSANASAAAPSR